jgi:hypothetical protein
MGEKRNAYRIWVGNRPLQRRRRLVDNIKVDLIGTEWDGMDWTDLAQDMFQWKVLAHGNKSSSSIKCREVLEWLHNWPLLKDSAP